MDKATPNDPNLGRILANKYKLDKKIGEGAMGSVYIAKHQEFQEFRAIKILREHLTADPIVRQRFRREVQLTRQACLTTDHIVKIYDDFRFDEELCYYVMEHLEGSVLQERIEQSKEPLPLEWIVRVTTEICEAMQAAHDKGIVFRDLKPSNIFLVRYRFQDDFVKVIDFGIAKSLKQNQQLTQAGKISGTPLYMSPEQIRGNSQEEEQSPPIDHRADIYSLGCVLYELLTGRPPFQIETWNSPMDMLLIFKSHLNEEPPHPSQFRQDLPGPIAELVLQALAKDPNARPQSMEDFSDRLLHALAHLAQKDDDVEANDESTVMQAHPQPNSTISPTPSMFESPPSPQLPPPITPPQTADALASIFELPESDKTVPHQPLLSSIAPSSFSPIQPDPAPTSQPSTPIPQHLVKPEQSPPTPSDAMPTQPNPLPPELLLAIQTKQATPPYESTQKTQKTLSPGFRVGILWGLLALSFVLILYAIWIVTFS